MPSLDLEDFKLEIQSLRRGKRGSRQSPHKLVLLLAVIELMDRGEITENKVYLSTSLIEVFRNIFMLVSKKGDWAQIGPPFFHLRTSGFWFHKVRAGCEEVYEQLTTTGGGIRLIERHIEYAYFRSDVYALLSEQKSRRKLREFLSELLKSPC